MMSADIVSKSTAPDLPVVLDQAPSIPATTADSANAALNITSESTQAAAESSSVQPTKPVSARITGLKPEQVLQELKKSGYVDQLRRQMFDAFTAVQAPVPAPSQTTTSQASAGTTSEPISIAPTAITTTSHSATPSASTPQLDPSTVAAAAPATTGATPSATSAPTLDLGSKPSFLSFLSVPLRHQVEEEHDNLRLLDPRGQQDKLLKLLESDPVDYPGRDSLGDATLYDLLIRHIVTPSPISNTATQGMLGKEGQIGRDATGRIAHTIAEMLNPTRKEGEDGEEDDEDDDDEDDAAQPKDEKMETD